LAILRDRYQPTGCFFAHVNSDRHPDNPVVVLLLLWYFNVVTNGEILKNKLQRQCLWPIQN
jgi:hypothetical protein